MSEERPIGELLAYLGGLGYTELYRRGESREARGRSGERPAGRAGERPAEPRPLSRPGPPPMTAPGVPAPGMAARAGAARSVAAPPPAFGPPPGAPGAAARGLATPPPGEGVRRFVPTPGPALPAAERARRLELLRQDCLRCKECRLCRGRSQVVFGDGHADADLMLIGEGPGAEEDRHGLPFVGAAGELLNKIIQAIGLDRSQVYIANVVKCRPPENRDPEHDEIDACLPFLLEQIDLVRPRLIVSLGRVAARTLLHSADSLARLRGNWFEVAGAQMRVTYHPAALLRDESLKRPTWEDMKLVRDRLKELREQGPKP